MKEEGKGFILSSADLTRAWRKEYGTKAGDPDDLQNVLVSWILKRPGGRNIPGS